MIVAIVAAVIIGYKIYQANQDASYEDESFENDYGYNPASYLTKSEETAVENSTGCCQGKADCDKSQCPDTTADAIIVGVDPADMGGDQTIETLVGVDTPVDTTAEEVVSETVSTPATPAVEDNTKLSAAPSAPVVEVKDAAMPTDSNGTVQAVQTPVAPVADKTAA